MFGYPRFRTARLCGRWMLFGMLLPALLEAQSRYPVAPPDPAAVTLEAGAFPELKPDDATAALQAAIDTVGRRAKFGLVFVPSGTYVLRDTVLIWQGVRVIGVGPERPRFVLPENTPGYATGEPHYLFRFVDDFPEPGQPMRDANPGTFYSALSNVEVVIGPGNPDAVGVRAHFAQHCFVAHTRFEIGEGLAGIQKVGNLFHDLEFIGGRYGIMTTKPSPSWPFALLNTRFEGQREAAILTQEAGLSIVRAEFVDVPRAVEIRPQRSEALVIRDSVARNVGELVLISNEENARTQINLLNLQCEQVSTVARFRNRGTTVSGRDGRYVVASFSHGLHLDGWNDDPAIETRLVFGAPPAGRPLVPADPARTLPLSDSWVDVTALGAVGDGVFDNTEVLQAAIDAHETLYFPTGHYRLTDTLQLGPETVLVGLNPITTRLMIQDETPAFHPAGSLKAVVESAAGGAAIVSGLGLDPGAINHRAVALKWRAGAASLVDDVRFLGGHGTYDRTGKYLDIYNSNRSGDADPRRRWDAMPTSLWVTDGGGGSFRNLWTPSPFAHAGMLVENTSTPGWLYQMSSEHHLRNEVILDNVRNWEFYALQFEEESFEGRHTLPLLIEDSSNLAFHNTYVYRVSRTKTPYPYGILIQDSDALRFHGIHAYGPTKFTVDATLQEADTDARIRSREIARLEIGVRDARPQDSAVRLPFELLGEGFNHLDSPEVDAEGRLYFVDAYHQTIYRWDPEAAKLERILDQPIEPEQIVLDGAGGMLVFSRVGKAYQVSQDGDLSSLRLIEPVEEAPPEAGRFVLPVTRWRDSHDFQEVSAETKPFHYRHRDLVIPAGREFVQAGLRTSYFRTLDLIRTYDLRAVEPGSTLLVSDEFDQKTWQFEITADGRLAQPRLFAEEGEAGVVRLPGGEVVILAGDLFVYDREGTLLRRIVVPDRPTGLALAGENRDRLILLARTRFYGLDWSDWVAARED